MGPAPKLYSSGKQFTASPAKTVLKVGIDSLDGLNIFIKAALYKLVTFQFPASPVTGGGWFDEQR